jgi:hypothetical protein
MDPRSLTRERLRRAAAAHVSARESGDQAARRLAEAARAAGDAGLSIKEIAEIVRDGSREALEDPRLAA